MNKYIDTSKLTKSYVCMCLNVYVLVLAALSDVWSR